MTIEMYPSDQVADLRAEVTHWYENLQKEQINQQAQLQEFGQSSRKGEFPGKSKSSDFYFVLGSSFSNCPSSFCDDVTESPRQGN
jgi:hypothetical protein